MSRDGGGSGASPTPPSWLQPLIYYNSPISMNPAGNGELLIGYADGHVYSFNPDQAAVSLVEDLTVPNSVLDGETVTRSGFLFYVGGFLNNRIASFDSSVSNSTCVTYWNSDTATTTGSAATESSIWDFDLPEQRLCLDGFHVICDVPTGGDYIDIAYQTDQDGVWHTVIPSGNSHSVQSSATGRSHYLPISTYSAPITMSMLQFRTTISGTPKVFSVTAQARIVDFQETWDIVLMLRDQKPGSRFSDSQYKADVLRDYLWTNYREKTILKFNDGYISKDTGDYATPTRGYNTYSVTIESIEDVIDEVGEGKAKVTLRKVITDAS
jgi:hypothetical protein